MGRISFVIAAAALLLSCSRPSFGNLKVEWCDSPICVDTQTPRFTWTYDGAFVQKSFELAVFDEAGSEVWNSGTVETGEMNCRSTEEMGLLPESSYSWRVTATGADGRKLVSDWAVFETAMFSEDDWTASWISDGRLEDEETAPVLKREFVAAEGFTKARLYISAAAYSDFSINGTPVFSSPLNPAYTDYGRRNLYIAKDVTSMLRAGKNEMFAVLGNGFYNVIDHVAVWNFDEASWRGRARMIAQLNVEYADGRRAVIGTDSSWLALADPKDNPYRMNNIYSGDSYDCRIPSPGPSAGTDSGIWGRAVVVPSPSGMLRAQYMEENVTESRFHAAGIRRFGDTVALCDFGTNLSGLSEFVVKGEAGAKLLVQHGECLSDGGRLDVKHMDEHFRPKKGHAFQTDAFILDGGRDTISDKFSYDGFRYAELRSERPFSVGSATASFVHTGLRQTGHFECSDTSLTGIHDMVIRSYLSNCMGIPTDCPQREKNGWTADGHVACEIGLLNFDSVNFYLKWIDDIVDNQREDGQICAIIPSHGWGLGIGPVWDAVAFVVPETVYDYTGDVRGIERIAETCRKYLEFLETREAPDGAICYGLGDWVPYRTETPNDYTSTCYYWYMLRTMARFEKLLGNDPARWQEKADRELALINSRWLDPRSGVYANGSQTAQSLALYLGIVPDSLTDKVVARLVEAVHKADNHLDCGMIGSKTLLRMLTKYGYADLAYSLATVPIPPSWAYWRKMGCTTMPEQWVVREGVGLSMNHVFLGDIDAWMYGDIAGINCDPEVPGFRRVVLTPHFVKGLDSVSASCVTASGEVTSSWKRRGNRIVLEVWIPANATAVLRAGGSERELSGGKRHRIVFDN